MVDRVEMVTKENEREVLIKERLNGDGEGMVEEMIKAEERVVLSKGMLSKEEENKSRLQNVNEPFCPLSGSHLVQNLQADVAVGRSDKTDEEWQVWEPLYTDFSLRCLHSGAISC